MKINHFGNLDKSEYLWPSNKNHKNNSLMILKTESESINQVLSFIKMYCFPQDTHSLYVYNSQIRMYKDIQNVQSTIISVIIFI